MPRSRCFICSESVFCVPMPTGPRGSEAQSAGGRRLLSRLGWFPSTPELLRNERKRLAEFRIFLLAASRRMLLSGTYSQRCREGAHYLGESHTAPRTSTGHPSPPRGHLPVDPSPRQEAKRTVPNGHAQLYVNSGPSIARCPGPAARIQVLPPARPVLALHYIP